MTQNQNKETMIGPTAVWIFDWHEQRDEHEPPCDERQWRTRDRYEVVDMPCMHALHLDAAIFYAKTAPQHASKLAALLAEAERRKACF